jgi:hypothetical protein
MKRKFVESQGKIEGRVRVKSARSHGARIRCEDLKKFAGISLYNNQRSSRFKMVIGERGMFRKRRRTNIRQCLLGTLSSKLWAFPVPEF